MMIHDLLDDLTVKDFDFFILGEGLDEVQASFCVCIDLRNIEDFKLHLLLWALLAEQFISKVLCAANDV